MSPLPQESQESTRHPVGLRFTESMKGFFSTEWLENNSNPLNTFIESFESGQTADTRIEFTIHIRTDQLDDLLNNPEHPATIAGSVFLPSLSPTPLTVTSGTFNLLVHDPQHVESKLMNYQMTLATEDGTPYFLTGFKRIQDNPGFDLWSDTTTLYFTLHNGINEQAPVLAKGMLLMEPEDFMKQLTEIEILHETNQLRKWQALSRFGHFFAGTLYDTYGGILAKSNIHDPHTPPRKKRPLRTKAPEVHFCTTSDGLHLMLTRYQGGGKGPVLMSHGFSMATNSFTIDTIDTNITEYLYEHGYDVWLFDYRSSMLLPQYAQEQFTVDDIALKDYPAAVDKVLTMTGAKELDVIVHCVASLAMNMALLSGLQGVRSAVCSQVGTRIIPSMMNKLKTGLYLPSLFEVMGIDSLNSYTDIHADWRDRLFNEALKLYPKDLTEQCNNPVCHRLTFIFGQVIHHPQLNSLTHEILHEMVGEANITTFEHLALLFRETQLLQANGEDVYREHLDRLAIPITFIHGDKNGIFKPKSTELSYQELCKANGADLYRRHVIKGYGHLDCFIGKHAVRDVYPFILEHLERVAK